MNDMLLECKDEISIKYMLKVEECSESRVHL